MRLIVAAATTFMLMQAPAHAGVLSSAKTVARTAVKVVLFAPKKAAYYVTKGMLFVTARSLYPLLMAQALLSDEY